MKAVAQRAAFGVVVMGMALAASAAPPAVTEETCRTLEQGLEKYRAAGGTRGIIDGLEQSLGECWSQLGGRPARTSATAFRQALAGGMTPGTDPVCRPGENCYDLTGGRRAARSGQLNAKDKKSLREKLSRKARTGEAAGLSSSGGSPRGEASQDGISLEAPLPQEAVAGKGPPSLPTPGRRWESLMERARCEAWGGDYYSVGPDGLPGCDLPPRSRFEGFSEEAKEPPEDFQELVR